MKHRLHSVNLHTIGDCVPFKDRNRILYDELSAKRLRRGFCVLIIGLIFLGAFALFTTPGNPPGQTVEVVK